MDNGICVDKMNENNYMHNIEDENKVAWKTVPFFKKFKYVGHCIRNLNLYYFP